MKSGFLVVGLLAMSCSGFAQLAITSPTSLPRGATGVAYLQHLAASGGVTPYTWVIFSGAPPDGLTFGLDGTISGIPTTTGTSTFTVRVTDANLATASAVFNLGIDPGPLTIPMASTLPAGAIGVPYSQTLSAVGGVAPYTWFFAAGGLPDGLTLSSAGVIAGIPTTGGTASFTVDVTDSALLFATRTFTLTITSSSPSITTPPTLPSGVAGAAYSTTLAATAGLPPYTWSMLSGALPPGLTLSAAGVIAGTPTTAGVYVFTVQAQDSAPLTDSRAFSLTVNVPTSLQRAGVLSQFAAGGGWDTTIWLVNRSTAPVPTNLVFHGDDGSPLSLTFTVTQPASTQQLTGSTLNATIAPNTTLVVAASGSSSVVQGWVDVISNGAVSGFAVFRNGGAAEAAVPLQTQIGFSISLPFDNTGGYSTGVALVNLSNLPASITATVWDVNGNLLVSQPFGLAKADSAGNGHDAFMLPDRLAVTAGIKGIVQFQGSPGNPFSIGAQLTGLGLKTDPNGLFTSIPTIVP